MSEAPSLVAELARMTAYFQLRTIALHMGAEPDAVDPARLALVITTDSRAACAAADAAQRDPPFSALGGVNHSEVLA